MDIAEEAHGGAKPCAASFDCAKASTRTEKMICGDKQASDLDFWVASYYRSAVQLSEQPALAGKLSSTIGWRRSGTSAPTCGASGANTGSASRSLVAQCARRNGAPQAARRRSLPRVVVRPPFIRPHGRAAPDPIVDVRRGLARSRSSRSTSRTEGDRNKAAPRHEVARSRSDSVCPRGRSHRPWHLLDAGVRLPMEGTDDLRG